YREGDHHDGADIGLYLSVIFYVQRGRVLPAALLTEPRPGCGPDRDDGCARLAGGDVRTAVLGVYERQEEDRQADSADSDVRLHFGQYRLFFYEHGFTDYAVLYAADVLQHR